jgi:hypothetical protein
MSSYKKDYLLKEVSRIVVDEFGAIDNSMIMYDSLLLKHIIISDMKGFDGRYREALSICSRYFSQHYLIHYGLYVEVRYLRGLRGAHWTGC